MSVPVPAYDYGTALRAGTERLYPATQYGLPETAPGATPPANGAPAPSGLGLKFSETLAAEHAKKGSVLTPDEIEAVRSKYKTQQFTAALWREKGMTQGKAEALSSVFDSKSQDTIDAYLASLKNGSGGAAANDSEGFGLGRTLTGIKDIAASTLTSAVGGTASGALSLADYGLRGANALIGGDTTKTFIGDAADAIDRGTQAVDRFLVSKETLAKREEFYRLMSDPNVDADTVVKYAADNPSALTGVVGNTLGMLTPATALRIPKIAKILHGLKEGGLIARSAGKLAPVALPGLPVVGQAGQQFEQQIQATPTDELRKQTPENEELYQLIKATGLPDATVDKTFKEKLANRGLPTVLATSAVANLALPLGNPFALEKQLAGTATRAASRLRRVTQTAAAEGTEEGLASTIEQVGQNVATSQATGKDVPVGENVGKNALLGTVLGATMGGVFGIPGNKTPVSPTAEFDTPPTLQEIMAAHAVATATPTAGPTAGAPAPSGAPTPTAGAGVKEDTMPAALLAATRLAQIATAGTKTNVSKGIRASTTPEEIVSRATVVASSILNFEKMNATQQLAVVETIATQFSTKASKVKDEDVAAHIEAMRTALNPVVAPAAAPPQVVEQPVPTDIQPSTPPVETPPVEAAPPVAAEAPVDPTYTPWFALLAHPSQPHLETNKIYVASKAAFDRGEIKSPAELKAFVEPLLAKPAAVPPPPTAKRGLRKATSTATETPPTASAAPAAAVPPPPVKAGKPLKTAPAAPAAAATEPNTLPEDLAKATPSYAYGAKQFKLDFASDIEKAMYIVSGKGQSKAHARYLTFLAGHGITPEQVVTQGAALRETIKEKARTGKVADGPLKIGYPETSVPAPPQKRGLKTPKTEAPTPSKAVGAQASETSAPNRESAQEAVKRILGDNIEEADANELVAAIELARDGENRALEAELKDLSGISQADKVAIREAAKSLSPTERGEALSTPASNEAPYVTETVDEAQARIKNAIGGMKAVEAIKWLAANGPNPAYRAIAKVVAARLAELHKAGAKLSIMFDSRQLRDGADGSTRYATYDNSDKFELELVFHTKGPDWETALHEYIHAAASLIQSSYGGSIHASVYATKVKANSALLEAARQMSELYNQVRPLILSITPTAEERMALGRSNFLDNEREFLAWGLSNYHFQNILKRIKLGPQQTGWTKFVANIRGMLGLTNTDVSALDKLLQLSEPLLTGNLDEWLKTVTANGEFTDYKLPFPSPILNTDERSTGKQRPLSIGSLQRLGEISANATYGLERAEQAVRKAGNEVPPELSPMYAGRKYTSDIPQIVNIDVEELVNPIAAYVKSAWSKFADTPDSFRKNSDLFFQHWHQLTERLPDMWMQTVPLNNGQNMARDILIDDANEGKIGKKEFYAKLTALVQANAHSTFEEWAKTTGRVHNIDVIRAELAKLKTKGYDQNTLANYNNLFAPVRARIQEHMLASGRIAPNDPWVEGRDWKWYFPLKGVTSIGEETADADYGSYGGSAKEFRSRSLEVMQGRKTIAGSVAEQIVSDLTHEGTKRAEGAFKETLFAFIQANLGLFGKTDITVITGTPKQGFTKTILKRNPTTRMVEPVEVPMPASAVFNEPANGFVFHQGDTHFRVRFDLSSEVAAQLDRGLKGFNNVQSFKHPIFKTVGMATNLIARGYTTYSPEWQFFVGFARDVNYIPAMVAVQEFSSPLKAGAFTRGYAKRILSNSWGVLSTKTFSEIKGDHSKLRKLASTDKFLQQLAAYRAAGGSTEYSQSLNTEAAYDIIFGAAKETGAKGLALRGYRNLNEWTSNWAQLLENKGRVAAWSTLVEDLGYAPEHAAAVVKGVMDFGQSGEWGRKINAWIAFYRVGATGADAIRRAFTTPTGKADWPKLAKWHGFFAALGSSMYMMMAAALGDDDHDKARILKYDLHTLTQKLIIPTGDGSVVTYPLGLGIPQLMMAPGIIATAFMNGHVTEKEATLELYDVYNRNAPIQPAGWQDGTGLQGFITSWATGALFPTAARPLQEITYNVNAFDTSIHTPFKDATKFRSDQGMQATPQGWKDMAKELKAMTGVDMYPEDIRHLTKGYFGQPASFVSRWTMDFANKEEQGLPSQAVRTSLRLSSQDEEFYYSREMNRSLKVLNQTQQRYKSVKDDPKAVEKFRADRDNVRRLNALKDLEKAKKAYYGELTSIRASNASPEGRRYARKRADSALRRAVESADSVIESTD